MNRTNLLIIILALSYMPLASAVSCNDESPKFIEMGDGYWEAEPLEITGDEPSLEWLKTLTGDWKGYSTFSDCRGGISNARLETKQYELDRVQIVENSMELLHAKLSKRDLEDKTVRSEIFGLLLNDRVFELTANDNQLSAVQRGRRVFPQNGTSVYEEKFIEMSLDGDTLTIEITAYFNTVFAYSEQLVLTRD